MNIANKLTMLRVLLIPVFILLLYIEFEHNIFINNISIALLVFIIAAITDLTDGIIARQRNIVTDFGKFMDPLADKVLVIAALLWFIDKGLMPVWLVLVVIVREFVVTGIRLIAAVRNTVLAATMAGKVKTAVTMAAIICMFLVYMFIPTAEWILYICWALVGVTTVVSGIGYITKNKDLIKMDT